MKIGLLVSSLLEFGMGLILIYVSTYRKNNIPKNKNQIFWKRASKIGVIWGWIIVIFSGFSMFGYLLSIFNK